jgi:hypothetical protein
MGKGPLLNFVESWGDEDIPLRPGDLRGLAFPLRLHEVRKNYRTVSPVPEDCSRIIGGENFIFSKQPLGDDSTKRSNAGRTKKAPASSIAKSNNNVSREGVKFFMEPRDMWEVGGEDVFPLGKLLEGVVLACQGLRATEGLDIATWGLEGKDICEKTGRARETTFTEETSEFLPTRSHEGFFHQLIVLAKTLPDNYYLGVTRAKGSGEGS